MDFPPTLAAIREKYEAANFIKLLHSRVRKCTYTVRFRTPVIKNYG
jgi:hypothetical protein